MRAGKLDRLIVLQRVETAPGPFNEPTLTWTDIATLEAQQRPERGGERFAAMEVHGQAVMTFHIRYRSDVTVSDRIFYNGRSWNILDLREIGRTSVTEIDVVARAEA
jgi:SPP1 family predicted phage head-tail adaptor